ncbi:siderophore-interacting protein [Aldersonia kunmingensis]|uniref:siderophore-interacting protein n=1 Tax=Aldersonia kunmingensis TaxID=408066 RepID=UPI0008342455|nr:siderophore-interacting protein [Aldersonia kunmingensis]
MAKARTTLTVTGSEWLNPHMVRLRFGGPGFDEFVPSEFTDAYVKIVFDQDGAEVVRSYTVRAVDPVAKEIVIDFVVHGDEGLAGPWAAAAAPGTQIDMLGPGGAYAPNHTADWHLFAGDEAAIPAIAAALEALPADAIGDAFIEVDGHEYEFDLRKPAGVQVTWLHRDGSGSPLPAAVRSMPWRAGQVHVFIHGEAETVMHDLRRYVRRDREVPAGWASISGYWRRGMADESFRAWKKELAAAEQTG